MYKSIVPNRSYARHTPMSLGTEDRKFETIGDKIIAASKYGADIGASMSVSYDEHADPDSKDYKHEVDVLSDPNHDFFDIAEQFGEMVEQSAPPQETNE